MYSRGFSASCPCVNNIHGQSVNGHVKLSILGGLTADIYSIYRIATSLPANQGQATPRPLELAFFTAGKEEMFEKKIESSLPKHFSIYLKCPLRPLITELIVTCNTINVIIRLRHDYTIFRCSRIWVGSRASKHSLSWLIKTCFFNCNYVGSVDVIFYGTHHSPTVVNRVAFSCHLHLRDRRHACVYSRTGLKDPEKFPGRPIMFGSTNDNVKF